jgi:alpha-glucosidase
LLKDAQFRDNLLNPDYRPGQPPKASLIPLYTAGLPEVHDAIEEMRRIVDAFGDRLLIGEIYLPLESSSLTMAAICVAVICRSTSACW